MLREFPATPPHGGAHAHLGRPDGGVTTLASYDALPYGSVPVPESHIERLAATAVLLGMAPPDTTRCRVLELGCAEGGNLIPMAFDLPDAEFVGVDLSRQQVAAGQGLVKELGLANIRLDHRDVAAGLDDLGEFDYIIAHGLYSWVPSKVREKILAICGRQLRVGGIAYISFNVLPGWHMRGVLRDFLRPRVDAATSPADQALAARELLRAALPAWQAHATHEARFLAAEAEHLLGVAPSYFFHEYLTAINEPCRLADFVDAAAASGLRYVGDTDLTAMLPDAAAAEAIESLGGGADRVQREQQLDYLAVRKFRRALLTRGDAVVADWPQAQAMHQLAFHADLSCDEELDLGSAVSQRFDVAAGGSAHIAHPLAKAAAMVLAGACPSRITYGDLLANAQAIVGQYGAAALAADAAGFERAWIELWAQQAVQPAMIARSHPATAGEKPLAHALARAQAPSGIVATARHGALRLDVSAAALLALCDGSRDAAALAAEIRHVAATLGKALTPASAQAAVAHLLKVFLRAGLLELQP